ncbi:hypothetical protein HIM_01805 [Hirsutella minnesotensis 3608]|nr:hypothetical protein HIM_01805 [Hirsutella minnesotensis 3608]
MASPTGPSRPVPIDEPGSNDEAPGSPSSRARPGRNSPESDQGSCPWRTSQLCDQECSRYLDCPSHTVARLGTPHGDAGEAISRENDPTTTAAAPAPSEPTLGDLSTRADMTDAAPTTNQAQTNVAAPESAGTPPPTRTQYATSLRSPTGRQASLPIRTSSMAHARGVSSRRASGRRSHSHDTPGSSFEPSNPSEGHSAIYSLEDYRDASSRRNRAGSTLRRVHSTDEGNPRPQSRQQNGDNRSTEFALPRWQPDAEVTYCPICQTQFSIFVRKHHCRKCGRVVCNSCSPHRIIIPHQYIVRPPGSEYSMPTSLLLDGLGAGYFDANGPSGGERVRLCNPCVPDPNTAPPQSPGSSAGASPRSPHQRSRSSFGSAFGVAHAAEVYGQAFPTSRSGDGYQYYSPRWRSIAMGPSAPGSNAGPSSHHGRISSTYHTSLDSFLTGSPSSSPASSRRNRHSSFGEGASSSRHRALPPPPQIAEEDECPICHRELPSRELPDFGTLRESHITMCIQSHSTYGRPAAGSGEPTPQPPPRRTGMYTYAATEKDCIDDAECTICLEEFTVGVAMARLECLCRFHKACISAWFVNHPGRCPVHQHDGFGF